MKELCIFFRLSVVFPCMLLGLLAVGQPKEGSSNTVRIAWDYSSMLQLAPQGGYPRLTRLQDDRIVAIFEDRRGSIQLITSADNGQTWSAPLLVFSQFAYSNLAGKTTLVNAANPEIKQLADGTILLACNYRPTQQEIAPYTIVVRRSVDNGNSWSPPQTVYTAAPRFKDGCWEPSFLQLPNGETHLYFANENPYRDSEEQQISLLRSYDNGATWNKEINAVSFRQNRRDGMPVAVLSEDQIVLVIEDNHIDQFKPYLIRSSLNENWTNPVLGNSPNRLYALHDTVADSVYMGAPYLLKLPNGQLLLSYQTNKDRAKDWELSTMEVAIGTHEGNSFSQLSQPFPVPLDKEAKWNALALWDANTVVALASTNFQSTQIAPWMIKGYVIPNQIQLHGKTKSQPFFVGGKSTNNLTAQIWQDTDSVYIACVVHTVVKEIKEPHLATNFFLGSGTDIFKIEYSMAGNFKYYQRTKKDWKETKKRFVCSVAKLPEGYAITYKLPRNMLRETFEIGFSNLFRDTKNNIQQEYLINMDESQRGTWIKVVTN